MADKLTGSTGRTPVHLWIIGIAATLWNAFGCYDYFMTRTQGAAYIKSMMPTIDADAMMAYINNFPIWAAAGWGLGVWGGLAGSLLLLMRNRLAIPTLGLSFVGAVFGIGYQLLRPTEIAQLHQGFNGAIPWIILGIALFLFLYARAMRAKDVIR